MVLVIPRVRADNRFQSYDLSFNPTRANFNSGPNLILDCINHSDIINISYLDASKHQDIIPKSKFSIILWFHQIQNKLSVSTTVVPFS